MKRYRTGLTILVLFAVSVYFVLFYTTRLPSLESVVGGVFRRAMYFFYLLEPQDFVGNWFGSPPEFACFDRVPVLTVTVGMLAYAASLGWLILNVLRADRGLTRLETFVFSTAVGLNVVSTYVLIIGLLGLLDHVSVLVVPALLTLAASGRFYFRTKCPTKSAEINSNETDSLDVRVRWLWLVVPFVLIVLLGGMLPPVDFDVREYHLQVPKEWFLDGEIAFLPHNVYGNMAMGSEMHALAAMRLVDDWWLGALIGKTLLAAFSLLTALGLLAAGRRLFSPGAGVIAPIVYLSTPWIVSVSTTGLVEGASGCYLLLATFALFLWHDKHEASERIFSPRLLMAGYLAGAAVATKYPAVLFVVMPLTVAVVFLKQPMKKRVATGAVFLAAVAVGCGLWFGKNAILTGNPTYPLLGGVFNGTDWTPEKNEHWNAAHRPNGFSMKSLTNDMTRVAIRSEWLSPLLMPLAVLAWGVPRFRRRATVLAAYFGFVLVAWWLATHRIDRFWIPTLPLVALLAGAGACWSRESVWRNGLIGLLAFGLLANFLIAASPRPGTDVRYFVRLDRLRVDRRRVDRWHRYFNTHAPDGCVLMVGEAEVFDLEMRVVYNTVFDDSIFERLVKGRTSEEVRSVFVERAITHVYVDWSEIDRYRSPGNYGFCPFVQPAVFERLVEQGVLEPLPTIEAHQGRGYRVTR